MVIGKEPLLDFSQIVKATEDYVPVWQAVSEEWMELTFRMEILPHNPHSSPGVSRGNEPRLPAPENSSLMHSIDFNHP